MAARASPRKPSVPMASSPRSSRSLLVAWRRKGHARVLGGHAAAVVRHAQVFRAAAAYLHRYIPRLRVERVLHELLDGGGRALHHLAGGDEVGDEGGEYVYLCHGHLAVCFAPFAGPAHYIPK